MASRVRAPAAHPNGCGPVDVVAEPTDTVRVLVADSIQAALGLLAVLEGFEAFVEVCGVSRDVDGLLRDIERAAPHVVLLSARFPDAGHISDVVDAVHRWHPNLAIAIHSGQGSRTDRDEALAKAAGASRWITQPISSADLVQILWQLGRPPETDATSVADEENAPAALVDRPQAPTPAEALASPILEPAVHSNGNGNGNGHASASSVDTVSRSPADMQAANDSVGVDASTRPPAADMSAGRMHEVPRITPRPRGVALLGQVFVVYSPKGGVGKSTIAVNLAMALAQDTGARVALVDLDLEGGDLSVMLNLSHHPTMTDVALRDFSTVDADLLDSIMADSYENVRVLQGPRLPRHAERVEMAHVDAIFAALRGTYNYVVVDVPAKINDWVFDILGRADFSVMLTNLDAHVINRVARAERALTEIDFDFDRIGLVVNATANPDPAWSATQVEDEVHMRAITTVPHDGKRVAASLAAGIPAVVQAPNSPFSRGVRQLVRFLLAETDVTGGGRPQSRGRRSGR